MANYIKGESALPAKQYWPDLWVHRNQLNMKVRNEMARQKAKLTETRYDDPLAPGGNRRVWIVSHDGQLELYYSKATARAAKAAIDEAAIDESEDK